MSGTTSQSSWTKWFDSPPDPDGDAELTENILKANGGKICEKGYDISGTECQRNNNLLFNESTSRSYVPDNLYYFCSKEGVWCRNRDQRNETCGDYSIRFKCKYTTPTSNDSGMFPQFDVRIYIILAVVPILIFIARILWTYVCRSRRRRQRGERRARRRQQGRYDDDESSTTPRAAKPPPSYHDIFGEPGHFKASVFAISRDNLPVCPTCRDRPCSVARVIGSPGSRSQKNSSGQAASGSDSAAADSVIRSQTGDPLPGSPRHDIVTFQQVDNTASGSPRHDIVTFQQVDNTASGSPRHDIVTFQQVDNTASGSPRHDIVTFQQVDNTASGSPRHDIVTFQQVDNTTVSGAAQRSQSSAEFVEIDLTIPSTSSETGSTPDGANAHSAQETHAESHAVDTPPPAKNDSTVILTISPSTLQAASLSISQPCACACHRTIPFSHYKNLGYDNTAFAHEGELAPHLPGMHVAPVPDMPRVWSQVSVMTLSELPSYEAALELMNKEIKEADTGS